MSSVIFTGSVASGVLTVTSISTLGSSFSSFPINPLITTSMVVLTGNGTVLGTITSQLSGPANQTGTYQLDTNSNAVSQTLRAEIKTDTLQGQGSFNGWFISTSLPTIYGANNNSSSTYGEENWVVPGTYSWTVPTGVTSATILCIGGGAGGTSTSGGTGGNLSWSNISLTPSTQFNIVVGNGGTAGSTGGDSYIYSSSITQTISFSSVSLSGNVTLTGATGYTPAGAGTIPLPEFTTTVSVQVQGAGGGTYSPSSNSAISGTTTYFMVSSIGGAGGYASGIITNLPPKATLNYTIGAAGTNGNYGRTTGGYSASPLATAGGNTTVSYGSSFITANGGGAGGFSSGSTTNTVYSMISPIGAAGDAGSTTGSGQAGASQGTSGASIGTSASGGTGGGGSHSNDILSFVGYGGGSSGTSVTYLNGQGTTTTTNYNNPVGSNLGTGKNGWSGGAPGRNGGLAVLWTPSAGNTSYATAITLQDVSMLLVGMVVFFDQSITGTTIVGNTLYWISYINTSTKVIGLSDNSSTTIYKDFIGGGGTAPSATVTMYYSMVKASGGGSSFPNVVQGIGGGNLGGGLGNTSGGGGAGGYNASGGAGGSNAVSSGGGGAGGTGNQGGGGVGIYGQGSDGAVGTNNGGSGGFASGTGTSSQGATGGLFGGGGGIGTTGGQGGSGAVRIIWGAGRSFPSTNTTPNNTNIGSGKLNLTNALLLSPGVPNNTQVTGVSGGVITLNANPTSVGKASFLIGSNSILNINSNTTMPSSFTNVHKTFVPTREDAVDANTKPLFTPFKNTIVGARIDIETTPIVGSTKLILTRNLNMVLTRSDIDGVDISLEKNIPTSTASSNNPNTLIQGDQNLTTNVEDRVGWGR
jgi:hypothetical protein